MSVHFMLIFLWGAFAATHMGMSAVSVRPRLVDSLGLGAYLGLYSLVALAVFVPLVGIYLGNRHAGPELWNLRATPGLVTASMLLSGACFSLTVASFFQPSPASLGMGGEPHALGLLRITRHPLFMPLAILGFSHLLLNGFLSDVIFFGGLLVFGVVGCLHQDSRKFATNGPAFESFIHATSVFPFAAIVSGRNELVVSELPWLGLVVGVGAAVGFYHLHASMFF